MAKGGSFENEVCRILSLWWSQGMRDDLFTRTGGSGGKFTSRKKRGKDTAFQSGDITFADPIGAPLIRNFNIECKTGYGKKSKEGIVRWDIIDIIDSKQNTPIIYDMWKQCCEDAEKTKRKPLLIFRRNRRTPCVVLLTMDRNRIEKRRDLGTTITITVERPSAYYYLTHFTIMSLNDFVRWIHIPEEIFK